MRDANGWINYLLAFFHRSLVIGIVLSGELAYSFDIKIIMHCYMLEIKMQSVYSGIIFFYFFSFCSSIIQADALLFAYKFSVLHIFFSYILDMWKKYEIFALRPNGCWSNAYVVLNITCANDFCANLRLYVWAAGNIG